MASLMPASMTRKTPERDVLRACVGLVVLLPPVRVTCRVSSLVYPRARGPWGNRHWSYWPIKTIPGCCSCSCSCCLIWYSVTTSPWIVTCGRWHNSLVSFSPCVTVLLIFSYHYLSSLETSPNLSLHQDYENRAKCLCVEYMNHP